MKKKLSHLFLICLFITILVTLGLGLILSAQAQTYSQNSDCYGCHAPGGSAISIVDFSVSPKITTNNCDKCHYWADMSNKEPHGGSFNLTYMITYNGYFKVNPGLYTSQSLHKLHSGHEFNGVRLAYYGDGYNNCRSCHDRVSCNACHTDVPHSDHSSTVYTAPSENWAGGYPDNYQIGWGLSCTTAECHSYMPSQDIAGTGSFNPNPQCLTCHSPATTDPFGVDRSEPHGYKPISHQATVDSACNDCHYSELGPEHIDKDTSRTSDGDQIDCSTCHESIVPSISPWDPKNCEQCHNNLYAPEKHGSIEDSHNASNEPNATGCLGSGCHETDARSIHNSDINGDSVYPDCTACHSLTSIPEDLDCTRCHTINHEDDHDQTFFPSGSTGCVDCHKQNVVLEHIGRIIDDGSGNMIDFTCATCHSSTDSIIQGAIETGKAGNPVYCDTCHIDFIDHKSLHEANPSIDDPSNPYGFNSCDLCHKNNLFDEHLTRLDDLGNPYNCATCHSSPVEEVQNAIENGQTRCDACHTIHSNLGFIHESPTSAPGTDCSECHYSNLMSEHAKNDLGCSVCHESTDPLVIKAIEEKDRTCGACHTGAGNHIEQHNMTSTDEFSCQGCHSPNVATEHVTKRGLTCSACHDSTDPDVQAAIQKGSGPEGQMVYCKDCHIDSGMHLEQHDKTMADSPSCLSCHVNNVVTEHVINNTLSCQSCHGSIDENVIAAIQKGSGPEGQMVYCSDCHPVSGHFVREPYKDSCDQCHSISGPGDYRHDYHTQKNIECWECHGEDSPGCVGCHAHSVSEIHSESDHPDDCTFCHKSGAPTPGPIQEPYKDSCDQCHSIGGPGGRDHDRHTNKNIDCMQCHGDNPQCANCHSPSYIHNRHDNKVPDCTFCHKSGVPDPGPIQEPYKDSCDQCHSIGGPGGYDHDRHINMNIDCMQCHGENPQCTNCHSLGGPGQSDHDRWAHRNEDCTFCHKSGAPKPHSDIPMEGWNDYVEGKGWLVCRTCHDSQLGHQDWPRRDCRPCHAPGTRKSVHSYYRHMSTSSYGACFVCHEVSPADQSLNCTNCHPRESKNY